MAVQKLYEENAVKNVAAALRQVTGADEKYNIAQMTEAVLNIYDSSAALEQGVRIADLAKQLEHPYKEITDADYSPTVILEIQELLNKLGGE